jgi:RNA polymerase sigma-70 factor (ECF subfamily)
METVMAGDAAATEATVRSAALGDEIAFARLVAEHHASMARVAFVICGDPEATQDAVQTAWMLAWRRLSSLRDPARVNAWLVAIAANEARKAARRRGRERVVDISPEVDGSMRGDPFEASGLVDLRRALRTLRPDERSLLAMRYAAGLDSNEIAAQMGMTASGVRSRLARVLERLRATLDTTQETGR